MEDSKNFYLYIYKEICKGRLPNQIREDIAKSKQNMTYYLNYLSDKVKVIEPVNKKNRWLGWNVLQSLTDEEFILLQEKVKHEGKNKSSMGMKIPIPKVSNLHALQIKFPILSGNINDKDWDVKNKLNNWIPKYKEDNTLGGLLFRNNNNKSITVMIKGRDYDFLDKSYIENLAFKIRLYVEEYFRLKHNVRLDIFECEVKNLDTSTEEKNIGSMLGKGEKHLVNLNRKAKKIFPKDDRDAKAWMDSSPFPKSIETNDIDWKSAYIMSPLYVRELYACLPALAEYNRNLQLHIEVQKEQLETQKNIQELLKRLGK